LRVASCSSIAASAAVVVPTVVTAIAATAAVRTRVLTLSISTAVIASTISAIATTVATTIAATTVLWAALLELDVGISDGIQKRDTHLFGFVDHGLLRSAVVMSAYAFQQKSTNTYAT
jgi:hypothetical protein